MTALKTTLKKVTGIGRGAAGVMEGAADPDQPYLNYGTDQSFQPGLDVQFIGVSSNEYKVPVDANGNLVSSTTPLGTTTLTTASFKTQGFGRIVGTVYSNSAGTLYTQFSNDNVNWDVQVSDAITGTTTANGGQSFSHEIVAIYCRFVYTPSASQTTFRFYPLLRRNGTA